MKKTIIITILSSILFGACNYLEKQVPSQEALLKKELKMINWKEVDEFPTFGNCDSLVNKVDKRNCFFAYLTTLIQQKLSADTLLVLYPKLDTINVKVTVFANSFMKFEPQITDSLSYYPPKIDSIIIAILTNFPKIKPAIKRGTPVKTEFVLPVILSVE